MFLYVATSERRKPEIAKAAMAANCTRMQPAGRPPRHQDSCGRPAAGSASLANRTLTDRLVRSKMAAVLRATMMLRSASGVVAQRSQVGAAVQSD
jgi:hypothetical protein